MDFYIAGSFSSREPADGHWKCRMVAVLVLTASIALSACARTGSPNPTTSNFAYQTPATGSQRSLASVETPPSGSATSSSAKSTAPASSHVLEKRAESGSGAAAPAAAAASVPFPSSAATSPSPPAPCDTQCLIDRLTANLLHSKAVFNAPTTLQVGQPPTTISLVLSVNESYDAIRQEIAAQGPTASTEVRSSPEMYASLTGSSGLRVTPTTQSIMAVPSQGRARWDWQLSGIQAGPQSLNLSLFAVVDTAPNSPKILIQTFSRKLSVTVTARYEITLFLENNWQWLWSVILAPLAVWLWKRRKRVGPTQDDGDS
jgi:hypothetical protein